MLRNKSQVALEYITTYALAFVGLVVVIGLIQYYGLLDFEKYLPQKCTLTSQLKCNDFSVGGGNLKIKVLNNIGVNIKISDILIENKENPPLICANTYVNGLPFVADMMWEKGVEIDIKFEDCSGGGYFVNERIEAIVRLQYYSPDTPSTNPIIHETKGRIVAVVGES